MSCVWSALMSTYPRDLVRIYLGNYQRTHAQEGTTPGPLTNLNRAATEPNSTKNTCRHASGAFCGSPGTC